MHGNACIFILDSFKRTVNIIVQKF